MAQKKLLLDSNSYFRLAEPLHPLLFVEFGIEKYCLYVISELDYEFNKSTKLQNKFSWVMRDEFIENRKNKLTISRKQLKAIKITDSIIINHAKGAKIDVSPVDSLALSYGKILSIPVVTDDEGMDIVANDFGIVVAASIEILKKMHECGHIDMAKIRRIVTAWRIYDKPRNIYFDYKRLFREDFPKI